MSYKYIKYYIFTTLHEEYLTNKLVVVRYEIGLSSYFNNFQYTSLVHRDSFKEVLL